jgi:hypothetical protein
MRVRRLNMTMFIKERFEFDGSYLMYSGPYEGSKTMDEVHPNCHPSWIGKQKPAFVARFKYGLISTGRLGSISWQRMLVLRRI